MLHRRLWLEALADADGLDLAPAEMPRERDARDHDWMYDAVLAQFRDVVVPRTTDPLAKARGKGVARIVKYLARVERYGPYYEECELEDLAKVLGRRPASVLMGGRMQRRRSRREPCPRRITSSRCGAGSLARPSWPVRPWACSPTATGPHSDDHGAA